MPDLLIAGIGLPAASIRGVSQTLEPIAASAQLMRTVNGALVDVSAAAFRKYASTIRCSDQAPPAFDGIWPGALVTVDCVAELVHAVGAAPARPVVDSRTEDGFVFYRPRLTMRVLSFEVDRDEWGAVVAWTMTLAGRAQILVVPDLEAGNMLAKNLTFLTRADAAGIVLGARVPIVLTSRADSVRNRLASCAVASLFAHARRQAIAVAAE